MDIYLESCTISCRYVMYAMVVMAVLRYDVLVQWYLPYCFYYTWCNPLQSGITVTGMCRHHHHHHQYAILGVCGIMLLEDLFNYWRYTDYNTYGYKPLGLSTTCLLLNVARSTVSRVLALVVALGYGIVRPTLGGDSRKVQTLGLLYAICCLWYNFFEEIRTEQVVSNDVLMLVILPLTTMDAIFYWWIFYALHRTLNQLKIRRQSAKLSMYRKYSVTLISAIISSAVMVVYQTYVLAVTTEDERWQQVCVMMMYMCG